MVSRINSVVSKIKTPHTIILNGSFEWFGRLWNVEKKRQNKKSLLPQALAEKGKKSRLDYRSKKVQKKPRKRRLKAINEQPHPTLTVAPYEPTTREREIHPFANLTTKPQIPWPHKKVKDI